MERYSSEWFEAVIDAMTEFVLVKGEKSKLLWANRAFLEYYGMSQRDLRGIVDAPHSDPDDTLQYVRDDHEVFVSGDALEVREPITGATGETVHYATIKSALVNDAGVVVGTVGTSRPLAQAEAQASEDDRAARKSTLVDLRRLVTHVPMAVATLDAKQRIVAHSLEWRRLFGLESQLSGAYYQDACETQLPLEAELTRALHTLTELNKLDAVLHAADGKRSIVNVFVRPFALPDERLGGAVVMVHDITELRERERELERVNEELGQFNYRISHDIVGPLRTISGLLDLCQRQVAGEQSAAFHGGMERLRRTTGHLIKLVDNVMEIARADAQLQTAETFSLEALLADAVSRHGETLAEHGIDLKAALAASHLTSERARIAQCLENLLSNAIKFRDPQEAQPWIEVKSTALEGATEISVSDNGVGLPKDGENDVFKQFYRGHRGVVGSGLGLYLVSKHLAHLGGSVAVASMHKPTRFILRIPNS